MPAASIEESSKARNFIDRQSAPCEVFGLTLPGFQIEGISPSFSMQSWLFGLSSNSEFIALLDLQSIIQPSPKKRSVQNQCYPWLRFFIVPLTCPRCVLCVIKQTGNAAATH